MVNINTKTAEFHPELRITETFSDAQVLGRVFSDEQVLAVNGLFRNISAGGTVKAGGRIIRELLGCKTIDVAGHVAEDATNALDAIDIAWIKPIIPILKAYPDEQKSKPDADFFAWNVDLLKVEQLANIYGLKTHKMVGTGNVDIVEIMGEHGSATIIDGNKSWQTQEWWPRYAVKAPLVVDGDEMIYKVNCAWDSMYTYPLEIPGIARFEMLDPRRVVVVGRSLLWQALSTDPQGHELKEPSLNTQREVVKTVGGFVKLLETIAAEPPLLKVYASGIRDMSLAMRMIVLNEPRTDYQRNLAGTFLESFRK